MSFFLFTDACQLLRKEVLLYKQQKLNVKKPPEPNPYAVLVTGISAATDEETIELYFSNKKKSCGDDIEEIKFFDPEHSFAVIIYKDDRGNGFNILFNSI